MRHEAIAWFKFAYTWPHMRFEMFACRVHHSLRDINNILAEPNLMDTL
jgi:hypothetical protein